MSCTTTVSTKFQVVIPKEIRHQISLKSGQKLQIIAKNGIITLLPDKPLKEFRGYLKGMDTTKIRDNKER